MAPVFCHGLWPPHNDDWRLLEWQLEQIRDRRAAGTRHRYRLPLRYRRRRERDSDNSQPAPVRAKPESVARWLEAAERVRLSRNARVPVRGPWRRERSRSP